MVFDFPFHESNITYFQWNYLNFMSHDWLNEWAQLLALNRYLQLALPSAMSVYNYVWLISVRITISFNFLDLNQHLPGILLSVALHFFKKHCIDFKRVTISQFHVFTQHKVYVRNFFRSKFKSNSCLHCMCILKYVSFILHRTIEQKCFHN